METSVSNKQKQWLAFVCRIALCVWDWLYRYHYGVGVHTIRLLRRVWRWTVRITYPVRRFVRYLWLRRVVLPVRRFIRRQRVLGRRMKPAFRQLKEAAKKSPLSVFPCFWHLCRSAVKNYWGELTALGRLVGPVAACVVLAVTVGIWTRLDFCLTVTYQGKEIGLVESAAVYDRGAALARGRVINADDSFEVDAVPTFTMTVRRGKATLSESEVCDAILRQSGDSIAQASGLYVDGACVGAMTNVSDIAAVLNNLLAAADYDAADPNQRAEFVQSVEIMEGLYPISIISKNVEELTEATRAHLQVQTVVTEVVEEEIDYKTKTVYREDKSPTYNKVTTKGQAGTKNVTYEYVYLDGEEIGVRRGDEVVTKEPVTEVREIGIKKTYASDGSVVVQGDGIATGKWTWPVPVCHNVYQGYHSGHLAWDISSGPIPVNNKACLAVDGGKVVYAGWYMNYGYYVKIDHGNGLYTVYAHLNSVSVVEGQLVSNGQQIGRVGNTGYSKGPHLHFEVIKNGSKVNPNKYIKP